VLPPGTIADATVRDLPNVRVVSVADGDQRGWMSVFPVASFTFHPDELVADVIQVFPVDVTEEDLAALAVVITAGTPAEAMAALTDLRARLVAARAGAAKPPEPTARGSVVVDVDGREWVRAGRPTTVRAWVQFETGQTGVAYDEIQAVRVLP
jgi:hypothetical protein